MKRVVSKEFRMELSEKECQRLFQTDANVVDAKLVTARGEARVVVIFRQHEYHAEQSVDLLVADQVNRCADTHEITGSRCLGVVGHGDAHQYEGHEYRRFVETGGQT